MLKLKLQPSKFLAIFFLIIHASATIAILQLDLHCSIKIATCIICFFSLIFYWQRFAFLKSVNAIIEIDCNANDDWQIEKKNGIMITAIPYKDSVVTPYFLLLIFKAVPPQKGYFKIPILFDAAKKEELRKLRVLLLTQRVKNYEGKSL
jgi:hypothetical protein